MSKFLPGLSVLIVSNIFLFVASIPAPCPEEYEPVCGTNGKTYANKCLMEQSGATLKQNGKCPCVCLNNIDLVCGKDGRNYFNECELKCNGKEMAHKGVCKCDECSSEQHEVCGADGETYDNTCQMMCRNVSLDYIGACKIRTAQKTDEE